MIMLGRPCHSRLGQQCFLLRLFIGVPIGWYLIVGTAAYGTYNIVFGEKPFSANVMLVDPVEANALCNAKAKE